MGAKNLFSVNMEEARLTKSELGKVACSERENFGLEPPNHRLKEDEVI